MFSGVFCLPLYISSLLCASKKWSIYELCPLSSFIWWLFIGFSHWEPGRRTEKSDQFLLLLSWLWHRLSGWDCIPPCLQLLQAAPSSTALGLTGSGSTLPPAFSCLRVVKASFCWSSLGISTSSVSSLHSTHAFCKRCFTLVSSAESCGVKFCLQPACGWLCHKTINTGGTKLSWRLCVRRKRQGGKKRGFFYTSLGTVCYLYYRPTSCWHHYRNLSFNHRLKVSRGVLVKKWKEIKLKKLKLR